MPHVEGNTLSPDDPSLRARGVKSLPAVHLRPISGGDGEHLPRAFSTHVKSPAPRRYAFCSDTQELCDEQLSFFVRWLSSPVLFGAYTCTCARCSVETTTVIIIRLI